MYQFLCLSWGHLSFIVYKCLHSNCVICYFNHQTVEQHPETPCPSSQERWVTALVLSPSLREMDKSFVPHANPCHEVFRTHW